MLIDTTKLTFRGVSLLAAGTSEYHVPVLHTTRKAVHYFNICESDKQDACCVSFHFALVLYDQGQSPFPMSQAILEADGKAQWLSDC